MSENKTLIKISEASVIAVHAVLHMINSKEESFAAKKMAEDMKVSYNHLSKVLQRLARKKLLNTLRGPRGGYVLTDKGRNSSLSDILSAVEGETSYASCFSSGTCKRKNCQLSSFLRTVNFAFEKLLAAKIKDL
ncbi:MAG: Rrf2 family transcriptional regulator [Elusimicrobia bacterium]|nr:Rrf2 family transcriptional regulator [Elusimicrobiota bacterium]